MKTLPVNKNALVDFMNQCIIKGIRYKYGAKVNFGTLVKDFTFIDCSGFVRWFINICSGVRLPDGSFNQRVYFQQKGFKRNPYMLVAGCKDSRLRICFINAKGKTPGHVFLLINGLTIESYGGKGVGRRKWFTPGLLLRTKYCFTITDVLDN